MFYGKKKVYLWQNFVYALFQSPQLQTNNIITIHSITLYLTHTHPSSPQRDLPSLPAHQHHKHIMIKEAKVVVIGSIGVGKSSITIRFVNNQFNDYMESTLGAVFFQKHFNYGNGKSIKFQFWDTAGQEKYKAIARIYYKDARIAVVVYDVNSRESFEAMKVWIAELKENGPKNILLAIVGNKIDLLKQKEEVPYKEAMEYAKELGAVFKYTSAKDNKGINQLFTTLAQQLDNIKQTAEEDPKGKGVAVKKNKKKKETNSKCC